MNDFAVLDDGNTVGCTRHTAERANDVWLWNVTIPDPGGFAAQRLKVCYRAGVIGVCQLLSLPVWQRVQRLASPFLKYLQNRV